MNIVELSGRNKKRLVQLALPLPKVKQEKLQWPMSWSEKLDGNYCIALKHQDSIGIFSRTGEQYTSMRHIESELFNVMDEDTLVIFEAYEPNTAQSVISGHCRDTKEQHPELLAMCHDALTLNEFVNGGTTEYTERCLRLIEMCIDELRHCSVIQQIRVDSMEQAMELTQDVWDRGGEGGVLRNPKATYAGGKRNQDIIKLKRGVSYDLEVVGVKIGKGKYSNTLGKLVCSWKDGKTLEVSGMTDAQRNEWWNNPDEIIGKCVQVDAMCESSKGLLREPRMKGIRLDKLEGDF